METTVTNPQIQAWMQELESVGRVEIKSNFSSLIWRVGLALAIVAGILFFRYQAGDIGPRGLTIAIVGFGLVFFACIAFVVLKYGGKSIVIEQDSLVTMEGDRVAWTDVVGVTTFSAPRSDDSVLVNLTEDAWNTHMAKQSGGGRMWNKANSFVTRHRSIVLPSYLDGSTHELAAWLNTHARGTETDFS